MEIVDDIFLICVRMRVNMWNNVLQLQAIHYIRVNLWLGYQSTKLLQ